MTLILTIIALLFATPAAALNSLCQGLISYENSVADQQLLESKIADTDCDVLLVQVDKRIYWMGRIAHYCRHDRQIVIENDPQSADMSFTCEPAR